tara:strand:- start:737 stop:1180 length:444 start_codon:yes stop_codon:yes gene_type:complete
MASFVYDAFKEQLVQNEYGWAKGSPDTYKILLLNTAIGTGDSDETTVAAVIAGDLEYTPDQRETIASQSITPGSGSTTGLDAADTIFTTLAPGGVGEQVNSLLLYVHIAGGDANCKPAAVFALATPFTGNGATVTFTWNAAGLITLS